MTRVGCLPRAGLQQSARARPHTHNPTTPHHVDTQNKTQVFSRCSPCPSHEVSSRLLGTGRRRCSRERDHGEPASSTPNAGALRTKGAGRGGRSPCSLRDAEPPTRRDDHAPHGLATPPLRRARGGAGRGVYKARGGRRSFVSCCSKASGSTWSASSERDFTVRNRAGLGAYPGWGRGSL